MTNIEKIQYFCGTDKLQPGFIRPFISHGYIYATDGRAIVRFKADKEAVQIMDGPLPHQASAMFEKNAAEFNRCGGAVWFPMLEQIEEPPKMAMEICEECLGNGQYFELSKTFEKIQHDCG